MSTTELAGSQLNDKPHGVGGLCHLVEAATALSKLVEQSPTPSKLNSTASPGLVSTAIPTPATQAEKSVISDDDDESSCKKNGIRSKREIFPQRLMAILNDASLAEVVTWLPNGRSFVIVRPDVFTESVLPKYLPPVDARGSTKYPSFTRKLNRWGFRQITRGPDTGAFHHPLFRRDEAALCLQMVCQRSRDRRSSGSGISNKSAGTRKKADAMKGGHTTLVISAKTPSQPTKPTLSPGLTTAYVSSSDDNASMGSSRGSFSSGTSSGSTGSRGRVSLLNVALPPATVCTTNNALSTAAPSLLRPPQQQPRSTMPKPPPAGYVVSKDTALIQEALRQSVENERIRAAKAMLYHSYMQALGASSR